MSNMLVVNHYIGATSNCPQLSLCVVMDCHEAYMLMLRLGDKTYAKPVWVVRALSQANFATSHPHLQQIQVE